jgi:ATP-binding cassette subfamily F protein 3
MQSKEILLKALLGFNGTIFFVSHDHDFINKLATRILELTPSGIESYEGNYNDYLYQKQFRTQHTQHHEIKSSQTTKTNSATDQLDGKQVFELRKQLKKLEQSIAKLEETIKTTELRFAELEYGTAEFQKNQTELLALRNNLEKNLNEWEYLLTQLDSL